MPGTGRAPDFPSDRGPGDRSARKRLCTLCNRDGSAGAPSGGGSDHTLFGGSLLLRIISMAGPMSGLIQPARRIVSAAR